MLQIYEWHNKDRLLENKQHRRVIRNVWLYTTTRLPQAQAQRGRGDKGMSDIMQLVLILTSPLIALIELLIISFIISILDMIFDDIIILKETIRKCFLGGDKE